MTGEIHTRSDLVQGEFFSDGKSFLFRLSRSPLTGVGPTPTAAFDDLMRVHAESAPLAEALRDHARNQETEETRRTIIRMAMIGFIVFGLFGGGLVATAAMLPRVASDVGGMMLTRFVNSLEHMPPNREAELSVASQHFRHLLGLTDGPADCVKAPTAGQP